jgi:hypothetical protein
MDNDRDRFAYGYDAGVVVDGMVRLNQTGVYELVDEDEEIFNPQEALRSLVGKKVRMTMISFEALENMENMYAAAQAAFGKSE